MASVSNVDPELTYYTGDIIPTNNTIDSHDSYKPYHFIDNRLVPIVTNMTDYELSVCRFQADCSNLPLWIPVIQPAPNTDVNLTIYSVLVKTVFGTTETRSDPVYVEWVSSTIDHVGSVPQTFNNPYYFLQTFSAFCDMVNTAINAAFVAANPGITPEMLPPVLMYDPTTDKFRIYFDAEPSATLTLYFNSNLALLLKHFKYVPAPESDLPGVDDVFYSIPFGNMMGMNSYNDPTDSDRLFYWVEQERPSTDLMSPVASIVFTTSIPIQNEVLAQPMSLASMSDGVAGQNRTDRIITDIVLPMVDGAYDYKGLISYIPDALRYSAITGVAQDLAKFDLRVNWKCTIDGNIYPLYANNNSRASIKCLFTPKS